jgi:ferrochelatase
MKDIAVLMMGYGGPSESSQVRPFVEKIARERGLPAARVEEVIKQYQVIGGQSPFCEWTRRQADALQACLVAAGWTINIDMGMLSWTPYINETIGLLADRGIKHIIGLIMAPHRSQASFNRYVDAAQNAIAEHGGITVDFVDSWCEHPLFIRAITEQVREVLNGDNNKIQLIFTAHSLPVDMDGAAHYAKQVEQTARLVAQALGNENWQVCYQSRSGNPSRPWLGPDVCDVIKQLAESGYRQQCLVPVGFVCDHVEVLYDLDVRAKLVAQQYGVELTRAKTVGVHGQFIQMLFELVEAKLKSVPQPQLACQTK